VRYRLEEDGRTFVAEEVFTWEHQKYENSRVFDEE
jgi:hypothetical protein